MELTSGITETEWGAIPSDWSFVPLGELCTHVTSGSRGWAQYYASHGDIFIRITNLRRSSIQLDLSDCRFVNLPDDNTEGARTGLVEGDLLISITADLGIIGIVPPGLGTAYINQHIALARLAPDAADPTYVALALASEQGYRRFEKLNDAGSKAGLNLPNVRSVRVPLPPTIREQRAIAATLSDADALVESLEQLISKKRFIKQGAMQDLLTGKRRLPGFEGAWTPTSLGRLGATYGGLTGKSKQHFGHGSASYVPFLNVVTNTVVDLSDLDQVEVSPGETQNAVRKGDLLFNGSSETPEEVGLCARVPADHSSLYLNSFCFGLRLFDADSVSGRFLAYFFRGPIGRDLMKGLAQGSTRYNLSKRALLDAEFALPGKCEQEAIAQILDDIDSEIEGHRRRLDKARQLKQGMMQQLLSGRVRLV